MNIVEESVEISEILKPREYIAEHSEVNKTKKNSIYFAEVKVKTCWNDIYLNITGLGILLVSWALSCPNIILFIVSFLFPQANYCL